MFDDEYLVLDGYTPEPEYYNGKVVCVDNGVCPALTIGKIYAVKDGIAKDDIGRDFPATYTPVESVEDMNKKCGEYSHSKFIEFKGE